MIVKTDERSYDKQYNIEWYTGNGRLHTTNATLENIGDGYFYFKYPNGGLLIIEQRAIRSLDCTD